MNKQRGSIELIIMVVVAVVAGGALLAYNHAITDATQLKASLATLQTAHDEQLAENAMLKIRQAQTDSLLKERQTRRNTDNETERKINDLLSELYRRSQPAREWRDTTVPTDVLRSLRFESAGGSSQDGKGTPPIKPVPAKPSS